MASKSKATPQNEEAPEKEGPETRRARPCGVLSGCLIAMIKTFAADLDGYELAWCSCACVGASASSIRSRVRTASMGIILGHIDASCSAAAAARPIQTPKHLGILKQAGLVRERAASCAVSIVVGNSDTRLPRSRD